MAKKKESIEKEMDNQKKNLYSFVIESGTPRTNIDQTVNKQKYGILLSGKVKDKRLFNDIIEYREQLLRQRITATITLKGTKVGETGRFKVVGILPEDEIHLYEYWTGRNVGSNEWNSLMMDFKEYMQSIQKMVIGVTSIIAPMKSMKVKTIEGVVDLK